MLEEAKGGIHTPYGKIASGWKKEDGTICYQCSIPVNTEAELELPEEDKRILGSGDYEFTFHEIKKDQVEKKE